MSNMITPVNGIMSGSKAEPVIGEGATFLQWSDRSPGTVVAIRHYGKGSVKAGLAKEVDVRACDYKVIKGSTHDGSAQYEITENENAGIITVYRRKKGWETKGGTRVAFGYRSAYSDPHF